jgi:pre-mRNA-splicing factor CDC5/CEF1
MKMVCQSVFLFKMHLFTELEMLSEARARLANTQGKKAKRKAREKQLEEARRLASLQKRRELRAAGIMGRGVGVGFFTGGYGGGGNWRKRKQQIDYNGELPFEKHVPAGFHDPDVDERRAIDDAPFLNKPPTAVDLPKRSRAEALARKEDRKKLKKRRDEEGPDSIFNKG